MHDPDLIHFAPIQDPAAFNEAVLKSITWLQGESHGP